MIEKTVRDYLADVLDVPVYMEQPENPPKKYVIVEKDGNYVENFISYPTFAIQSYAGKKDQAAVLNELVKSAMNDIIKLPNISKSSLSGDYPYMDEERKEYRYQSVYDLVVL